VITAAINDTREPNWIQALTYGGVPTVTTALPAGDVMATCDDDQILLIERKTPTDLLNTLRQMRLFPQCQQMTEITPWSYLVITDTLYRDRQGYLTTKGRGHTGWNFDSVQGALLTCQEMGVSVVTCGGNADFEQCVIRLCNRDRGTVRIKPPREAYMLRDGEAALAALPGIGPERVQAIMDRFSTVAGALEWLTNLDHKLEIPGVAEGIKAKVKTALGLDGLKLYAVPEGVQCFYSADGSWIAADETARDWILGLSKKETDNDGN
jgi:ERCC4-type nuclease